MSIGHHLILGSTESFEHLVLREKRKSPNQTITNVQALQTDPHENNDDILASETYQPPQKKRKSTMFSEEDFSTAVDKIGGGEIKKRRFEKKMEFRGPNGIIYEVHLERFLKNSR